MKDLRWRDIMPEGREIVILFVQGKGKSCKLDVLLPVYLCTPIACCRAWRGGSCRNRTILSSRLRKRR
jgi:hypothetical protein